MKSNIEILLGEWGRWKARENRSTLGYPGASAFTTMRVDGLRRADPDVFLVDDDMRRVDRLIEDLYAEVRVIVVAHYVWPGRTPTKIARLQTTQAAYYSGLRFAVGQLEHWMAEGSQC